jgi:hypothetical protein
VRVCEHLIRFVCGSDAFCCAELCYCDRVGPKLHMEMVLLVAVDPAAVTDTKMTTALTGLQIHARGPGSVLLALLSRQGEGEERQSRVAPVDSATTARGVDVSGTWNLPPGPVAWLYSSQENQKLGPETGIARGHRAEHSRSGIPAIPPMGRPTRLWRHVRRQEASEQRSR